MSEIIGVSGAASQIGVGRCRVYQMVRNGQLRPTRHNPIGFDLGDVIAQRELRDARSAALPALRATAPQRYAERSRARGAELRAKVMAERLWFSVDGSVVAVGDPPAGAMTVSRYAKQHGITTQAVYCRIRAGTIGSAKAAMSTTVVFPLAAR